MLLSGYLIVAGARRFMHEYVEQTDMHPWLMIIMMLAFSFYADVCMLIMLTGVLILKTSTISTHQPRGRFFHLLGLGLILYTISAIRDFSFSTQQPQKVPIRAFTGNVSQYLLPYDGNLSIPLMLPKPVPWVFVIAVNSVWSAPVMAKLQKIISLHWPDAETYIYSAFHFSRDARYIMLQRPWYGSPQAALHFWINRSILPARTVILTADETANFFLEELKNTSPKLGFIAQRSVCSVAPRNEEVKNINSLLSSFRISKPFTSEQSKHVPLCPIAHFAVSNTRVQRHSLQLYKLLFNVLSRRKTTLGTSLEYSWGPLFDCDSPSTLVNSSSQCLDK
jgi:hypothetical protein